MPNRPAARLASRGGSVSARAAALQYGDEPGAPGNPAEQRHWRALARPAALGPRPVLVQGKAQAAADQRQERDGPETAHVPGRLPSPPLHHARGSVLRVEDDQGAKAKQPYAIGMKDGSALGLAGLWEN